MVSIMPRVSYKRREIIRIPEKYGMMEGVLQKKGISFKFQKKMASRRVSYKRQGNH